MVTAVLVLAVNLRPAVNAMGAVMPELRVDTGLSGTAAGVLLALPTMSFALLGAGAPTLARLIGSHRTVVLALVAMTIGQVWRACVTGTASLFLGSILAMAGVAATNVLLPGLVRLHFPNRVTTMTAAYTTLLAIGGTSGSGLTLPIQHALGQDWRTGIGVWALTAAVALIPWLPLGLRRRDTGSASPAHRMNLRALARSPLAWAMAGFFGCQSMQAYIMFGWLPAILADAGLSDTAAAAQVAILVGISIPISAVVPTLLGRLKRQGFLVVMLGLCYLIGYLWLMAIPARATWAPALLIGIGAGTFPMALTLMALRSRTFTGTIALSAFSQSVGYLIASVGPIGFGFLHDVSGGWRVPLIATSAVLVVLVACGLVVVRDRYVEDDLPMTPTATPLPR